MKKVLPFLLMPTFLFAATAKAPAKKVDAATQTVKKEAPVIPTPVVAEPVVKKESAPKKDTSVVLRGEHKEAEGYKVYFNEGQTSYLKLTGYTIFDYQPKGNNELTLYRFRLYFDGQTSSKWSFHTRVDPWGDAEYSNKKTGATSQFTAIYLARAYATYKANETWSFDFGRNLNQLYLLDYLELATLEVAPSVISHYKNGDFSWDTSYSYTSDTHVNGEFEAESKIVSTGVKQSFEFSNESTLLLGLAGTTKFSHNKQKLYELIPGIRFNLKSGTYWLAEFLYQTTLPSTHKEEFYTEIGTPITESFAIDLLYKFKSAGPQHFVDQKYDSTVGIETFYKINKAVSVFTGVEYDELAFTDKPFAQHLTPRTYISYEF